MSISSGLSRRRLMQSGLATLVLRPILEVLPALPETIAGSEMLRTAIPAASYVPLFEGIAKRTANFRRCFYGGPYSGQPDLKALSHADFPDYLRATFTEVARFRSARDKVLSGAQSQKDEIRNILGKVIAGKRKIYVEALQGWAAVLPSISQRGAELLAWHDREGKNLSYDERRKIVPNELDWMEIRRAEFIRDVRELAEDISNNSQSPYHKLAYKAFYQKIWSVLAASEQYGVALVDDKEKTGNVISLELRLIEQTNSTSFLSADIIRSISEAAPSFMTPAEYISSIGALHYRLTSRDLEAIQPQPELFELDDDTLFKNLAFPMRCQMSYALKIDRENYRSRFDYSSWSERSTILEQANESQMVAYSRTFENLFRQYFPDVPLKPAYMPCNPVTNFQTLSNPKEKLQEARDITAPKPGRLISMILSSVNRGIGNALSEVAARAETSLSKNLTLPSRSFATDPQPTTPLLTAEIAAQDLGLPYVNRSIVQAESVQP